MGTTELVKGGAFLLEPTASRPIFTREMLTEEQLLIGKTAWDFIERDVLPRMRELEDPGRKIPVNVELMRRAGELGLLGIDVPEEYGGMGLDLTTSMLVAENVGRSGSFSVSMMAHNGIGILPLRFFGSAETKKKYLSRMASGEALAAYALTEAATGSDALAARTQAVLSSDGKHWILTGEKMWITNAGFSDLFTVFAKVDGDKLTGFLVERATPGFEVGKEEHKMGILGSSTAALMLDGCRVPVENVIGEIGKGHKASLGILDIGRFKLGVACLGAGKWLVRLTAQYANQRKQFGMPISSFGMIRRKFAEMAMRLFALESMAYRTARMFDDAFHELPPEGSPGWSERAYGVLSEYDAEASIIKIYGSEALDFVADECVQSFGGFGYSDEYPVSRAYRDSRINRIFEGTNEVNRLTIFATLMRKVMKGQMDFMGALNALLAEIKADGVDKAPAPGLLGAEVTAVNVARKLAVYTIGSILQKHMATLQDRVFQMTEFEFPMERMADMIIELYAMDSAVCRARQIVQERGEEKGRLAATIASAHVYETVSRLFCESRLLLADVAEGDATAFARYEKALTRLYHFRPMDLAKAKNFIAAKILEAEGYVV
jgi:alkylation response protein AidB-like acyl-CoA dehydrogenase